MTEYKCAFLFNALSQRFADTSLAVVLVLFVLCVALCLLGTGSFSYLVLLDVLLLYLVGTELYYD